MEKRIIWDSFFERLDKADQDFLNRIYSEIIFRLDGDVIFTDYFANYAYEDDCHLFEERALEIELKLLEMMYKEMDDLILVDLS